MAKTAGIIVIGNEILSGKVVDTNSPYLCQELRTLGVDVQRIVVIPDDISCCGFAGDKGFSTPELNQSALRSLKDSLPKDCREGFSTSRTCEIGLSYHSGIEYKSIVYLVERCSQPLNGSANNNKGPDNPPSTRASRHA